MACMEHDCANPNCNETQFNNSRMANSPCPKCGGRYFHSTHDEFGSGGAHYINVHTCTKCKKEQYNRRDVPHEACGCGNNEFYSLIEDSTAQIKTKSDS